MFGNAGIESRYSCVPIEWYEAEHDWPERNRIYLESAVDPTYFTPDRSITLFAMAVIGGLTTVGGAVVGAAYVVGFDYFLPSYSLLATGAGMLLVLMFFPGGLAELGFTLRDAFLRTVASRRKLIVPSLVADVRQEPEDLRGEEAAVVSGAARTAAALDEVAAAAAEPKRRAKRARVDGSATSAPRAVTKRSPRKKPAPDTEPVGAGR